MSMNKEKTYPELTFRVDKSTIEIVNYLSFILRKKKTQLFMEALNLLVQKYKEMGYNIPNEVTEVLNDKLKKELSELLVKDKEEMVKMVEEAIKKELKDLLTNAYVYISFQLNRNNFNTENNEEILPFQYYSDNDNNNKNADKNEVLLEDQLNNLIKINRFQKYLNKIEDEEKRFEYARKLLNILNELKDYLAIRINLYMSTSDKGFSNYINKAFEGKLSERALSSAITRYKGLENFLSVVKAYVSTINIIKEGEDIEFLLKSVDNGLDNFEQALKDTLEKIKDIYKMFEGLKELHARTFTSLF